MISFKRVILTSMIVSGATLGVNGMMPNVLQDDNEIKNAAQQYLADSSQSNPEQKTPINNYFEKMEIEKQQTLTEREEQKAVEAACNKAYFDKINAEREATTNAMCAEFFDDMKQKSDDMKQESIAKQQIVDAAIIGSVLSEKPVEKALIKNSDQEADLQKLDQTNQTLDQALEAFAQEQPNDATVRNAIEDELKKKNIRSTKETVSKILEYLKTKTRQALTFGLENHKGIAIDIAIDIAKKAAENAAKIVGGAAAFNFLSGSVVYDLPAYVASTTVVAATALADKLDIHPMRYIKGLCDQFVATQKAKALIGKTKLD